MKLLYVVLALSLPLMNPPAVAAEIDSKSLAGDWYGEGQPGNPNVYWLDHLGSDGSFATEVRNCDGGVGRYHMEAGSWSSNGSIVRITTDFVNGRRVHYMEEYQIVSFDGHTEKDRLITSNSLQSEIGAIFVSVRQPKGFTLPDCRQIS